MYKHDDVRIYLLDGKVAVYKRKDNNWYPTDENWSWQVVPNEHIDYFDNAPTIQRIECLTPIIQYIYNININDAESPSATPMVYKHFGAVGK